MAISIRNICDTIVLFPKTRLILSLWFIRQLPMSCFVLSMILAVLDYAILLLYMDGKKIVLQWQ